MRCLIRHRKDIVNFFRPGLLNVWFACPKWQAESFPWHPAFTAVPNIFISFALPVSLNCEQYVYIYTYPTAYRLYMNYSCYQLIRGPGSLVSIVTDYGLDGPGSNPGGDEIFRPSRPALGPIQPPVQWVPGLSRG